MKFLIRKLQRIVFYILKYILWIISLINHRTYMFLYTRLLRFFGMKCSKNVKYIGYSVVFDDINLIELSSDVVVSDNSHFLTHDYSISVSLRIKGIKKEGQWKRPIFVGKNTFIGKKSIIMPGSKIGDNVIVGAGSVVRGTLDSNYIYAGNPIQKLMSIDDYNMRVEKFKNEILWD